VVGSESTVLRTLYPIRTAFTAKLRELFPEPAAGFILAILVGDRSGMPDGIQQAFRRTGTVHVMALSGYNVSILAAAIIGILGRRPASLVASVGLIVLFVLVVGPAASIVRAALMGSYLILGQLFGRPQTATLACLLTAGAMLLIKPWSLRYDLGFDLSFLATLGILYLEPAVAARLGWLPRMVRELVAPTIAASIPSMPVIAATFGTVSLISPVANVLVVPWIPWLMLAGFGITVVDFAFSGAMAFPAAVVGAGTNLLIGLVGFLAALPLASLSLGGRAMIGAGTLAVGGAVAARNLRRAHVSEGG
jgi:competence protein ComEC